MWVRNWNCSDEGRNRRIAIELVKKVLFLLNTHIEKLLAAYKLIPYVKLRLLKRHNIVESECIEHSLWSHYHTVYRRLGQYITILI